MSTSVNPPGSAPQTRLWEARRAPAVAALPTARILGIPLGVCDYAAAVEWIDAMIDAGQRGYVSAAAVHLVMVAQDDPSTRAAVLGATLVVPDGQPLVWALHALGHRRATRVYGPDLMARCCERASHTGRPMYLYGGHDERALATLTAALRRRYPGIRIVGGWSPPHRPLTAQEQSFVIDDIDSRGAEIVWVGIGQPKQELWMAAMRERLQAPMLIGVGAAFDFHAGLLAQAPHWMQRSGLEWTYRLAREPRRLWKRYARYNPRFVAAFARQYGRQLRR